MTTPSTSGRDDQGRFAAGNPGGLGNPYARRVAALRSALLDCVTAEEVVLIAQALLTKAKAGDVAAAKLVLAYALGKPAVAADPDRLDAHEWQTCQNAAAIATELQDVLLQPSADLPLELVRSVRPAVTEATRRQLHDTVAPDQPTSPDEETRTARPPSPNGRNGHRSPSPNGTNGHRPPSANGTNGRRPPSPNGTNGPLHRPSPYGDNGPALWELPLDLCACLKAAETQPDPDHRGGSCT